MDFSYIRPETVSGASQAARTGDLSGLKALVESCEASGDTAWLSVDNRGWGPLHWAAYSGHSSLVDYLCSLHYVDLNSVTWEGETALFLACKALPLTRDCVHSLLRHNASVNTVTNERCSPLQYAAVKIDSKVVKWLVRKGARLNQSNVWGEVALHCTLKRGAQGEEGEDRMEVVRYLLKHGARPLEVDENQLTPLMLAASKGFNSICSLLLTSDGSSYSKTSAHANLRAEDGATALHLAAQGGHLECVNTLLGCGADVNVSADDGTTAVHLACTARTNSSSLLEILLPLTDMEILIKAAKFPTPENQMPIHLDRKVLNPFKLAIDWENFESLPVLAKFLAPSSLLIPLSSCFLHKDVCGENQFCDYSPYRTHSPLSYLLNIWPLKCKTDLLEVFRTSIQGSESHSSIVTPLLSLLTTSLYPFEDLFHPKQIAGKALDWLLEEGYSVHNDHIMLLMLDGSVSSLFNLISRGVLNPRSLVDPSIFVTIREMMTESHFESSSMATRLLCSASVACHCGFMSHELAQDLTIMLGDQLGVFQSEETTVLDKIYKDLKTPKSLQSLTRSRVFKCLNVPPMQAFESLGLPYQIVKYLLFGDVDVHGMIQDYKTSVEFIQENSPVVFL